MAKNIASENIFDGLKGGPAAADQRTTPVSDTVSSPSKPTDKMTITPRGDKNRTARAQIILTPELKKRAVMAAQHTGVSFNELVNQLLEQYCTSIEHNKE